MNRKIILCAIFLLIFPFILAACGDGQIDINSASTLELDKLTGIGPVYAERIVGLRPYGTVDELIDVSGIGPVTLDKIKTQGLACVAEEQTEPEVVEEDLEEESEPRIEKVDIIENPGIEIKKEPIKIENAIIDLSPQTIKSENDTKNLSKEDCAKYGLGLFCVLLFGLFAIKKYKPRKNEFR